MKPAPVDYVRAGSAAEAARLLADADEDAKLLAGGQSLVPTMNLRLARPSVLVDVSRAPDLRGLSTDGPSIVIGAGVRHRELERDTRLPGAVGTLVREAARHIGHLPIRTRGTLGGSLAHADPAAEWPLVALATGATVVAVGPTGRRRVAADDLFETVFTTSLAPDEVLAEVHLPHPGPGTRAGFAEISRRAGDFALVACAVVVEVGARGIGSARVALGGVADRPVRCPEAEEALVGRPLGDEAGRDAGRVAAAATDPRGDIHADARTRRDLVAAMVRRAVASAAEGSVAGRSAS